MKLIRQIDVYAPEYLGKKDVLVAGNKIVALEDQLSGGYEELIVEEISGEGKLLTPGFIDAHFHIFRWRRRRRLSQSHARSHT